MFHVPRQETLSSGSINPAREGCDIFATTRWTVVLAAGQRTSAEADRALADLCRTYWFPLYAYVRRRGFSREDAEDLTQSFFARFLEKDFPDGLSAERGKFRAFLLASLKHFLANERDKAQTQKRGGQAKHFSIDGKSADSQFEVASTTELTPDKAFDREWAVALLARVIERLQSACVSEGRARQFEGLKPFLTAGKGECPHAEAALALGMDEAAVRVAVHRLRKRYRQLLRDEISQTLFDPSQVDEEMRALFRAFAK
jgi:RNA polymerase sigma-70 factor (ECF subfamily)